MVCASGLSRRAHQVHHGSRGDDRAGTDLGGCSTGNIDVGSESSESKSAEFAFGLGKCVEGHVASDVALISSKMLFSAITKVGSHHRRYEQEGGKRTGY